MLRSREQQPQDGQQETPKQQQPEAIPDDAQAKTITSFDLKHQDPSQFYDIIERIGIGGFAKVFKVKRKSDNAICALKFVEPKTVADRESVLNEVGIMLACKENDAIVKSFVKIVVEGVPQAGRTSVFNRYVHDNFKEGYVMANMTDFGMVDEEVDGEVHKLQVWQHVDMLETAGALKAGIWREANGALLVFDLTSTESFEAIEGEVLPNMVGKYVSDEELAQMCVILVGTKSDLTDERKVEASLAEEYAERKGFGYIEVSSKLPREAPAGNLTTAFNKVLVGCLNKLQAPK